MSDKAHADLNKVNYAREGVKHQQLKACKFSECSDPKKLDTKNREISEQRQVAVHGNDTRIQWVSSILKLSGCVWSYKHPQ